jgi:hypothetical protein
MSPFLSENATVEEDVEMKEHSRKRKREALEDDGMGWLSSSNCLAIPYTVSSPILPSRPSLTFSKNKAEREEKINEYRERGMHSPISSLL